MSQLNLPLIRFAINLIQYIRIYAGKYSRNLIINRSSHIRWTPFIKRLHYVLFKCRLLCRYTKMEKNSIKWNYILKNNRNIRTNEKRQQQTSQTIYNNKPLPNIKLIEHPSGTAKLAFERIFYTLGIAEHRMCVRIVCCVI